MADFLAQFSDVTGFVLAIKNRQTCCWWVASNFCMHGNLCKYFHSQAFTDLAPVHKPTYKEHKLLVVTCHKSCSAIIMHLCMISAAMYWERQLTLNKREFRLGRGAQVLLLIISAYCVYPVNRLQNSGVHAGFKCNKACYQFYWFGQYKKSVS